MDDQKIEGPVLLRIWRRGRLEVGLRVYRHRSHLPDRWVFQPWVRYDRKST